MRSIMHLTQHITAHQTAVCQWRTPEFLNKKILAHLGAVYSKFYTLFWPKTLYLHCILQGFYHFYFCASAPQYFAFVHPRSRRKGPYSAVWTAQCKGPSTNGFRPAIADLYRDGLDHLPHHGPVDYYFLKHAHENIIDCIVLKSTKEKCFYS